MTAISIDILIPRPRQIVWEELRHIDRHVHWMSDAVSIDFQSQQHEGVGTTFDCLTKVGPFKTKDVMSVTRWDDAVAIGVTHHGLFTGHGEFLLADEGTDTRMTWRENLVFPWWFAGSLGAFVARPLLCLIWKKNLSGLARLLIS
ncbi:MAG: hypothetical protein HKL85_12955 [Acidimicrobiaceae bacterium]|nr:hypothetical protein [Acidimicrobiaceae bacterium]